MKNIGSVTAATDLITLLPLISHHPHISLAEKRLGSGNGRDLLSCETFQRVEAFGGEEFRFARRRLWCEIRQVEFVHEARL